jgi:hypothetical protein
MVTVTSSKIMAKFVIFLINIMGVSDSNLCPGDQKS